MSSKQSRSEVKKIPLRKCVGCQEMVPKKELLRVVRTPEGETVIDRTGRMNGRGAYLCRNPECLQRAQRSKALQRSLQTLVTQETIAQLEKEMNQLAGS